MHKGRLKRPCDVRHHGGGLYGPRHARMRIRLYLAAGCLFENVRPTTALPHNPEDGIINILRPVHDVEIELRGGIRVQRSKWLARTSAASSPAGSARQLR
jgi:hypothetical protein